MENRMSGSVSKFARNTKGAFAMQFALMAMPLCVCTGLAIDGGRAFLAHYELASALDAAASPRARRSTKTPILMRLPAASSR
jgi:Flp pilus assembly protein TadG